MILGNTVRSGAGRENPNLTMGSNSSQREITVSDFSVATPIDV